MVFMDSFRNCLLALIIGLVVTTPSVTLVAVPASTDHEVRVRFAVAARAPHFIVTSRALSDRPCSQVLQPEFMP